ncbi:MAG: pyruvate dehydrogenase (acetyl-transferring) E1 component subunit alpha [Thaumarchaeota archaeon]|nr:pyruvate dehydrogenase (acetyl-transferring) E1 component subunit alpha [Nitrososphaerota archaeon]
MSQGFYAKPNILNTEMLSTGRIVGEDVRETIDPAPEEMKKIYTLMVLVRAADIQAITLQRQGRIGFYVPCQGEEASQVGSAYALKPEDWAFTDYRAPGIVITRGMSLKSFYAHLMANSEDNTKGRSMPSHWGSKALNIVTPSSPICTQLPHAVGVALGAKMKGDKIATIAYFGDGGTSSNDFHSALNFAGVFKTPTVFFCRNNGYAISIPVSRQTASSSLAVKAVAYGIEGIQVDGNDALAVYSVTKKALEKARNGGGPTLIESITYRMGPHTTSDDPKRYRDDGELEEWKTKDPLNRLRSSLEGRKLWGKEDENNAQEWAQQQVKEAIAHSEKIPPPHPRTLLEDVYSQPTWNLQRQLHQLSEELGGS